MLILDTDHLSELDEASSAGSRLYDRLRDTDELVAATIISAEEQLRGWLAQIHRAHSDPHSQIVAYERLQRRIEFYANWTVLPWDRECADLFSELRLRGVRIGSMDLKIACIALKHDARLLSRNQQDFSEVPGLKCANWLI